MKKDSSLANIKIVIIALFFIAGPFFLDQTWKILTLLACGTLSLAFCESYAGKNQLAFSKTFLEIFASFFCLASIIYILERALGWDFFLPLLEKIFYPLSEGKIRKDLVIYCIFLSSVILLILGEHFNRGVEDGRE